MYLLCHSPSVLHVCTVLFCIGITVYAVAQITFRCTHSCLHLPSAFDTSPSVRPSYAR